MTDDKFIPVLRCQLKPAFTYERVNLAVELGHLPLLPGGRLLARGVLALHLAVLALQLRQRVLLLVNLGLETGRLLLPVVKLVAETVKGSLGNKT